MQCRKCHEEIPVGYTFCRNCATSIYVDDEPKKEVETTYVNQDIMKKIMQPESIVYDNDYDSVNIYKQMMESKDQNNMKKAVTKNMIDLIIIVSVILVVFITLFVIMC